MSNVLDTDINTEKLKKLTTVAGAVTVVIVAFYVTGLYRNYLQIKKLKQQASTPLSVEDD